jgi:hypothetical protein
MSEDIGNPLKIAQRASATFENKEYFLNGCCCPLICARGYTIASGAVTI